jgi:Co/Zn/Cd efflux system component
LWIALVLNVVMFGVEIVSSFAAQSVSLLADAIDFLGDAGNYGVALFVLGLAPVWRSRTALWKGWLMIGYGVFVLGKSAWQWTAGVVPEPVIMGWVSVLALAVNVGVAALLYAHRQGDAQARSVWLCSRNDALGNLAVLVAAGGVWATGQGWPDIAVALVLAGLALTSGMAVIGQARAELRGSQARV